MQVRLVCATLGAGQSGLCYLGCISGWFVLPREEVRQVCVTSGAHQTGLVYLGCRSAWLVLPRLQVRLVCEQCHKPRADTSWGMLWAFGGWEFVGVVMGGRGTRAVGFVFKKKGP